VKRKHHELKVWQEAMGLVKEVYRITADFPPSEIYSLTSQMRRAAVSIPSNIAEGAARNGEKEFLQFLSISRGSLSELETQMLIAVDLGYMDKDCHVKNKIEQLFGLLGGLMKSIRDRSKK
jgi:four helix bundle protein